VSIDRGGYHNAFIDRGGSRSGAAAGPDIRKMMADCKVSGPPPTKCTQEAKLAKRAERH